jgi:hypothetical protein
LKQEGPFGFQPGDYFWGHPRVPGIPQCLVDRLQGLLCKRKIQRCEKCQTKYGEENSHRVDFFSEHLVLKIKLNFAQINEILNGYLYNGNSFGQVGF